MSIDDFQPMWLDPVGRGIYAALHSGALARPTTGVVLVPPLLHEQATSRRFLTEVAAVLAAQGLPSLRFDFFGTGDSGGSGEDLDFASISTDLDLAVAALAAQSGVQNLVLLAWRGAALAVDKWLQHGRVDLIVLWEPVTDGLAWLHEIELLDAAERTERLQSRFAASGGPCGGQLMGFPVSQRLREDLMGTRQAGNTLRDQMPVWVIERGGSAGLPMGATRRLVLPAGAPAFGRRAAMDAAFFLTPPIRNFVNELGQTLREQPWQQANRSCDSVPSSA